MLQPIRFSVDAFALFDHLAVTLRKEEVDILKDVKSVGLLSSKYIYTKIKIYAAGPGLEWRQCHRFGCFGRGLRSRDTLESPPRHGGKSPGRLDKS